MQSIVYSKIENMCQKRSSKYLLILASSFALIAPAALCADSSPSADKPPSTDTTSTTSTTPAQTSTSSSTQATGSTPSDTSSNRTMMPANRNKDSWDHSPASSTPGSATSTHPWPNETQSNSTPSLGGAPTGVTTPSLNGLKPWPDSQSTTGSAPPVVAPKPAVAPSPPGFDAAYKLYSAKKWALAQKAFEGFVKNGTADAKTHECLAYCYYYQKVYSKAVGQYDWLVKNAKNMTMQRSAENTARVLKCYRAGVCPANCIKANDPRWHKLPGHGDELWMTFPGTNGSQSWSEHHIGQLVTYVHGNAENMGTCPTCGGTGIVKVLKDGAPPPSE